MKVKRDKGNNEKIQEKDERKQKKFMVNFFNNCRIFTGPACFSL